MNRLFTKSKICYLVFAILLFLTGGIIFYCKTSPQNMRIRDYIIVQVSGLVKYKYPLPFVKGLMVWDIISCFDMQVNANSENIKIKFKKQWVKISGSKKIYHDSEFKIGQ